MVLLVGLFIFYYISVILLICDVMWIFLGSGANLSSAFCNGVLAFLWGHPRLTQVVLIVSVQASNCLEEHAVFP